MSTPPSRTTKKSVAERFNFTDGKLRKISPPTDKDRLTVYDSAVPKLALRITKQGARTFYIIKKVGSKTAWAKLGSFPDMGVETAREEAIKLLTEFVPGASIKKIKKALQQEPTLADAFEEFITGRRKRNGSPLSPNTISEYRREFESADLDTIRNKKLSEIAEEDVEAIANAVTARAPVLANRITAMLSGVFDFMQKKKRFSGQKPTRGVQQNAEVSRTRALDEHELPRFYEALEAEPNLLLRNAFKLAMFTGARRENVLEMRWSDVDPEKAVWNIPRTKGGAPQSLPLTPPAIECLNELRSAREKRLEEKKSGRKKELNEDYVFPSTGKTGHVVEPKAAWERVMDRDELTQLKNRIEAAGHEFQYPNTRENAPGQKRRKVEGLKEALERARRKADELGIDTSYSRLAPVRIHDLRRTFGSWQANTGATALTIGKSLNHKDQKTTLIYTQVSHSTVRMAMKTASKAMLDAVGKSPLSSSSPNPKTKEEALAEIMRLAEQWGISEIPPATKLI